MPCAMARAKRSKGSACEFITSSGCSCRQRRYGARGCCFAMYLTPTRPPVSLCWIQSGSSSAAAVLSQMKSSRTTSRPCLSRHVDDSLYQRPFGTQARGRGGKKQLSLPGKRKMDNGIVLPRPLLLPFLIFPLVSLVCTHWS